MSGNNGSVKYRLREMPGSDSDTIIWIQRRVWFRWKDWLPVVNEHRKAMQDVIEYQDKLLEALQRVVDTSDASKSAKKVINEDARARRRSFFGLPGNISNTFLGKPSKSEAEVPDCKKEYEALVKKWRLLDWLKGGPAGSPRGQTTTAYYEDEKNPPDIKMDKEKIDQMHQWKLNQSSGGRRKNKGNQNQNHQQNQNHDHS